MSISFFNLCEMRRNFAVGIAIFRSGRWNECIMFVRIFAVWLIYQGHIFRMHCISRCHNKHPSPIGLNIDKISVWFVSKKKFKKINCFCTHWMILCIHHWNLVSRFLVERTISYYRDLDSKFLPSLNIRCSVNISACKMPFAMTMDILRSLE